MCVCDGDYRARSDRSTGNMHHAYLCLPSKGRALWQAKGQHTMARGHHTHGYLLKNSWRVGLAALPGPCLGFWRVRLLSLLKTMQWRLDTGSSWCSGCDLPAVGSKQLSSNASRSSSKSLAASSSLYSKSFLMQRKVSWASIDVSTLSTLSNKSRIRM